MKKISASELLFFLSFPSFIIAYICFSNGMQKIENYNSSFTGFFINYNYNWPLQLSFLFVGIAFGLWIASATIANRKR